MTRGVVVALILFLQGGAACRDTSRVDAVELRRTERTRQQQFVQRLAAADASQSRAKAVAKWLMPPELKEISGLALTADGRLLAHDDNVARIFVIDPRTGVALKEFLVGTGVRGDFEGITIAGSDIYLLESKGKLYRFREGANGASVPYTMTDTRLGHECEFEGVAFQPDSAWLVMPCKIVSKKKLKDELVIYRWRLEGPDSTRLSMLTIPMEEAAGGTGSKTIHPSDITIDPTTGNYVLIASHAKAIIEITPAGQVVRAEPLPGVHNQAEGVAITRDNILIVSDEENRTPAAITLYRWRP